MDYKNMELAKQIANVSLRIESGTKVYLKYKSGDSIPLIKLIIEEISAKGGIVFPIKYDKELNMSSEPVAYAKLDNTNNKSIHWIKNGDVLNVVAELDWESK